MQYAKLNPALTEAIQVNTSGNVQWDDNNFCTAEALVKDGKAEQFRVVELIETEAPAINPITHRVQRNGCELVEGQWQYRWEVTALSGYGGSGAIYHWSYGDGGSGANGVVRIIWGQAAHFRQRIQEIFEHKQLTKGLKCYTSN